MRSVEVSTVTIVRALIARLGSADAVAKLAGGGITARSVQRHADGTRVPTRKHAAKYAEIYAAHRIKQGSIDGGAKFDPSRPTLDVVIRAAAQAEELLAKAMSDPDASYRDKAGAIHALSRTLRDLATLRGELEPTETSILRMPAYCRLRDEILAVMKDFPDAAAALLAKWQAYEAAP